MGEIVKMTCRKCGESYRCKTGAGMEHGRLDSAISSFNKETMDNIMDRVKGQKFPLFSFGYQPLYCETCNKIVSVPVLQLMQEKAYFTGECPECQKQMDVEQLQKKLICPSCRSSEFDMCRDSFWD